MSTAEVNGATNNQGVKDPAKYTPGGYDPAKKTHKFETSEIWWWNCTVWGQAGYAIPNDGGKNSTGNEAVQGVHEFLGSELFDLMHRPDVKFSRPFNVEWLQRLNKMLTLGLKRLGDISVGWTDERDGDATHSQNTPQTFVVYPVPYFGQRIRQRDARRWCGWTLQLLGELMQHSDNDYDDNITDFSVSMVQTGLKRIRNDMAMKYFGKTKVELQADGFALTPDDFAKYDPSAWFTDNEMTEERMPNQWWPSTNDLTKIAGIPSTHANVWVERWPVAINFDGDHHAQEAAFPGASFRDVKKPGA